MHPNPLSYLPGQHLFYFVKYKQTKTTGFTEKAVEFSPIMPYYVYCVKLIVKKVFIHERDFNLRNSNEGLYK